MESLNSMFFRIKSRRLWGDYGQILISGICTQGDYFFDGTPISITRTGPFVPEVYLLPAAGIIVTDNFKSLAKRYLGPNVKFRPVIKEKVVDIPWHKWDLDAASPKIMPKGNVPENYLSGGDHSETSSESMGELWQMFLPAGCRERSYPGDKPWRVRNVIARSSWTGEKIFRTNESGFFYATAEGKSWLERTGGEWLDFDLAEAE